MCFPGLRPCWRVIRCRERFAQRPIDLPSTSRQAGLHLHDAPYLSRRILPSPPSS